jgi:hypothetical protein
LLDFTFSPFNIILVRNPVEFEIQVSAEGQVLLESLELLHPAGGDAHLLHQLQISLPTQVILRHLHLLLGLSQVNRLDFFYVRFPLQVFFYFQQVQLLLVSVV